MVGVVVGREVHEGLLEGADAQRGSRTREQGWAGECRVLQAMPCVISCSEA